MEAEAYFSQTRNGGHGKASTPRSSRVLLGFTVTIEEGKQHHPESAGILMPFLPRSDCSSSYFISAPFHGLYVSKYEAAG